MRSRTWTLTLLVPLLLGTEACEKEEDKALTLGEAAQALDEATVSTQAMSLTSSSIEITTDFTIGQAVEDAAAEIRTFIQTQLPCAEIELAKGTLTVTYGALPGSCRYNGKQFSGSHTITVVKTESAQIQVDHVWNDLSDGFVSVTGSANVTWDFQAQSRNVQHEMTWKRLSDGRTGTGTGDRTQTVLEGGLFEGIKISGDRAWNGESGQWDLAINDVEMRWIDPVPQSGSYFLRTPKGKGLTVSFDRVESDRIQVTVASGEKSFDFDVASLPAE